MNGFFMFPSLFPCVYAKGRIQEVSKGECGGGGHYCTIFVYALREQEFYIKNKSEFGQQERKNAPLYLSMLPCQYHIRAHVTC